ncbi:uncharacterized protein LOC127790147 [Diospyros lotus]|uniref:uncharacterized protein LOC127790147 n=1 Tax=Diospyros lotus TaxID=55363 RepID=UPI00225A77C0|nr:uncharacterized protein LOC127790147 [Diospyros lotus]
MGTNRFLTVVFLLLFVSNSSSAFSLLNLRKLIGGVPNDTTSSVSDSPLPSPTPTDKGSKSSPFEKPKGPQLSNGSPKANPNASKDEGRGKASASFPTQKQLDNGESQQGKEESDGKAELHSGSNGSCKGSTVTCTIQNTMTACIQGLESGSKSVLLVQNEGESTLKVTITNPVSLRNVMNDDGISPKKTKTINITPSIGQITKMVLSTGNNTCVLVMGYPSSEGNIFQRLPLYYKQVTPIYGAYLSFLIALIVGGIWVCCKFSKRRQQDAVPYQELEMGMPESSSAVNLEAADGWDDGWDDDWDDDKAVKSPGGRMASISVNGLTARSSNRDGWEKDWDD